MRMVFKHSTPKVGTKVRAIRAYQDQSPAYGFRLGIFLRRGGRCLLQHHLKSHVVHNLDWAQIAS